MVRNNKEVILDKQGYRIYDTNKNLITTASLINYVYQLNLNRVNSEKNF